MSSALPVYEDPAAEHARLDRLIKSLLEQVGRTSGQLDDWVAKKFQTTCAWQDLSPSYKEQVVTFLQGRVKKNGNYANKSSA